MTIALLIMTVDRVLNPNPVQHYSSHASHGRQILYRVPLNHDDIRQLPSFDATQPIIDAEESGVLQSGCHQYLHIA